MRWEKQTRDTKQIFGSHFEGKMFTLYDEHTCMQTNQGASVNDVTQLGETVIQQFFDSINEGQTK